MKLHIAYIYTALFLLLLNYCNAQTNKAAADTSNKRDEPNPWSPSDSTYYMALKDSVKLVHIKNQFYRNKAGKLFEKIYAPQKADDLDAGIITFFRITNQDVDPLTFRVIGGDSWFAKDKNFVYNYRGNDEGMFCITMHEANVKYFKLLPDDSGVYGVDNKHVFEETDIIENIDPKKMRVTINKDKSLVKITSGQYVYKVSWGTRVAKLIKRPVKHKHDIPKS